MPVCSDYFRMQQVKSDKYTLEQFHVDHRLRKKKPNVFLELGHEEGIKNILDVLLMDKVKQYCVFMHAIYHEYYITT